MENTIKELANASEKMNPIHAMRLLTKLFVDNCGVSLGYRSVAYYAIWDWLADVAPVDIMPLLCEKCTEELLLIKTKLHLVMQMQLVLMRIQ